MMDSGQQHNEVIQTSSPGSGPKFRPYASSNHKVTKGRYITSNDPRGYIPVHEYPLNGQWLMMDMDDGYILWTGIWKALGNSKADIVKMIDSQPELASVIRRVRGGYLKIQGTWMPYEVALRLSRRVAWNIRHELIPLFGPTFPESCLSPDQPGYGQVVAGGTSRRRRRAVTTLSAPTAPAPRSSLASLNDLAEASLAASPVRVSSTAHYSAPPQEVDVRPASPRSAAPSYSSPLDARQPHSSHWRHDVSERSQSPYPLPRRSPPASFRDCRYTPYPDPSRHTSGSDSYYHRQPISPFARHETPTSAMLPNVTLAPIRPTIYGPSESRFTDSCVLPPISALEDVRSSPDSRAVLRRLMASDNNDSGSETERPTDGYKKVWERNRSLSGPAPSIRPLPSGYYPTQSYPALSSERYALPPASMEVADRYYPNREHSSVSPMSDDGRSTCDPSPISPATPLSTSGALSYTRTSLSPRYSREASKTAPLQY